MEKLAMHGGGAASGRLLGYGRQTIDEDDVAAVADVLRSDFLTCGPATERFERAVAEAAGARYATAVANGTAALHVACLAAGIGPGDEVVVSPITFAASANCVLYCGGTPVFADIDSRTWNVSPESIRERISIGTVHGGKPVGSIADMTTFSFHPVKTVTAGEGGAVATSDPELARRVDLFAKHGITRDPSLMGRADVGGWYYEQIELGYNYRISDIEAALGASQLRRLPEFSRRRRQLTAYYDREFAAIPEVASQLDPAPEDTTRHLYVLRFDLEALGVSRRFVFDALRAENIGVNVHYLPVYRLPYYAGLGYDPECCPEANRYYEEAVPLPLHCGLSDEDARCVVEAVRKVVGWCRAEKGRSV